MSQEEGLSGSRLFWLAAIFAFFLLVPALGVRLTPTSSASSYVQPSSPLAPLSSGPATYHGGPIQHHQSVYLIFWLPSGQNFETNNSRYEALISRYFNDIGGSSFYSSLVQYPDNVNASPTSSVTYGGAFIDSSPYPHPGTTSNPLTGQDIINEIQKEISGGSLPTGINYLYVVLTANGVNSCETQLGGICSFPQSGQNTPYCAYHSFFYYGSNPVTYINVLDNPVGPAGGCIISLSSIGASAYPNNDAEADSAINLVSQQEFDVASNPLLNAWYDSSNQELSSKCSGQYGSVNSTSGANIALNHHPYIVQLEWSNAFSACSLTPPKTSSISVTLIPSQGANSISATNYFPITYAIGSQLFVVDYSGNPLLVQADPNTTLSISGISSTSYSSFEKWCFNLSCQGYIISLGVGSTSQSVALSYYDLLAQTVYEASSDGSQPFGFASISYNTAPLISGASPAPLSTSAVLNSSPQVIWTNRGSSAGTTLQTEYKSATERWLTPVSSYTITQPQEIPLTLSYHQFEINFTYAIANGGTASSSPSVTFTNQGQKSTTTAGTGSVWVDSGTLYNYSSLLLGSTSSQRWASESPNLIGTVSYAQNIQIDYYDQNLVVLSYQISNGAGGSSPPIFSSRSFGSPVTFDLSLNSTNYWLDAGASYSYSNPLLGSTSTQRWYSLQGSGGIVNQSSSKIIVYQHQFEVNFVYTVSGGGQPPNNPVLIYYSTNGTNSVILSNSPSELWINAGSNYTVKATLAASNSSERWAYNSLGNVANSSGTIQVTLYHQFEVGFNVSIIGVGSVSPGLPVLNTTMFGQMTTISVTDGTHEIWIDAGASYNFTNPLTQSGSSERWISSISSGLVASNETVGIDYYHQYLVSFGYSMANGGTPASGPSVSINYLGKSTLVLVNQTLGQVWADSPSQYAFSQILGGSTNQERWVTNGTVSGPVAQGMSVSLQYDHQYFVNLATNPQAIATLTAQSGWFDPGSELAVRAVAPQGWQFQGWQGQGDGAYSGTSPVLLLTVSSPLSETATFYTALTISASGEGSVSYSFQNVTGSVGQGQTKTVFVPPGEILSITASPIPVLFAFSHFTGNISGGPNATSVARNPFAFSLNGPAAVAAGFKINIFGIVIVAVIVAVGAVSTVMLLRRNKAPSGKDDEEEEEEEGSSPG